MLQKITPIFTGREVSIKDIISGPNGMSRLEERELALATAGVNKIKAGGPPLLQITQDGFQLVAGKDQLELARILGQEALYCYVFNTDVPDMLVELKNLYRSKSANPMQLTDLIVSLVDVEGFQKSQIAKLLKAPKSTVSQLYKLNILPCPVKKDIRAGCMLPQSELFRIAALPTPAEQDNAYWTSKIAAAAGSGTRPADDLTKLREVMLRAAISMVRFQCNRTTANKPVSPAEGAQLRPAIVDLSEALDGLESFAGTNGRKKKLITLLRKVF